MTETSPVRVALVGLGHRGLHHLERLSLRDDLVAVAAHDPDAIRVRRAQAHVDRLHSTPEELLHDPAVELVLIATPVATHFELARAALRCGKHVLLEQPLCAIPQEADELLAAAQDAGRMLAVTGEDRHDDDFHTALTTVRAGRIGEVKRARFELFGTGLPSPAEGRDDDREEAADDAFDARAARCVGRMLRLVSSSPMRVYGRKGIPEASHASTNDERRAFLAIVDFANGAEARIDVDLDHPAERRMEWTLIGSEGAYRHSRLFTVAEDGEIIDTPIEPPSFDPDTTYANIARHLRHDEPLNVAADEARNVVVVLDAIQRSARLGKPVDVSGD